MLHAVNGHRGEDLAADSVALCSVSWTIGLTVDARRRAVVRRNIVLQKVILIRWRHYLVVCLSARGWLVGVWNLWWQRSLQVDLPLVRPCWRLNIRFLAAFRPRGDVSELDLCCMLVDVQAILS